MAGEFSGTYAHALDPKGRLIVPSLLRTALGDNFTIALNSSIDALALYPKVKWDAISATLAKIRETDNEAMDYLRFVMAHTELNASMDLQGRVLIASHLREAVGIGKNLVLVGMLDFIEVWDAEAYQQRMAKTRAGFAQLMQKVNTTY